MRWGYDDAPESLAGADCGECGFEDGFGQDITARRVIAETVDDENVEDVNNTPMESRRVHLGSTLRTGIR